MDNQKLFLISTAEEIFWETKRKVIFLGEWCKLYERKHIWENMNSVIASPFGITSEEKRRNTAFVESTYRIFLEEIADILNYYHKEKHSLRYWEIILGHWLQRYVAVIFNRYNSLVNAISQYEIKDTKIIDPTEYDLATLDSNDFVWACNDNYWNQALNSRILLYLNQIETKTIPPQKHFFRWQGTHSYNDNSIKRNLKSGLSKTLKLMSSNQNAVILNSYLPKKLELKLNLAFHQFPLINSDIKTPNLKVDMFARKALRMQTPVEVSFKNFLKDSVFDLMPICFIEGYNQLKDLTKNLNYPTNPKFIFTSNNFDLDEGFKIYTAKKVEKGTPYIIGQHGNNYGTHICDGNSSWPERSASDKFITWGWSDLEAKCIPGFIFKTSGKNRIPRSGLEPKLLLIENLLPHRIYTYDNYFEFSEYQEDQFHFFSNLKNTLKSSTIIRLHGSRQLLSWSDEKRWRDRFPEINLDNGVEPIWKLIKDTRIVVHSYDSTGILETLSLNIPTICFWQKETDHLLESAKPIYSYLREAGIWVRDSKEAAELINDKWDNVLNWWNSKKVQNSRQIFCDQFAKISNNPVKDLKKLLLDCSANQR